MEKRIFVIVIILSGCGLFSQSIRSSLRNDMAFDVRANSNVTEVTTDIIFYNSKGKEIKKEITVLNAEGKILSELRYDEEKTLTARLFWQYDASNIKCVASKYERWHKIIGYSCEITTYEYDTNGFLVGIRTTDQAKNLLRETTITNNERGDAVELIVRTDSNTDYGKETATYDYDLNIVHTKVLNKDGKVLSESKSRIDHTVPDKNDVVNEFGDELKSGDYEFKYKYDKKNNWTQEIRYKIKNGKKVLDAEFNRKIKYTQ